MANEIIGLITCPHCGNSSATVHAQKKGGKLYYRCYASAGSMDSRCGTVQITGPAGQAWIKSNMKTTAPAEPEQKPEPKGSESQKQAKGSKAGLLSWLLDDEEQTA